MVDKCSNTIALNAYTPERHHPSQLRKEFTSTSRAMHSCLASRFHPMKSSKRYRISFFHIAVSTLTVSELREFKANDLLPELDVVARPLGAAIVNDFALQGRVVELLEELNEQARVDRSSGLQGVVVRAVLFHCHESDQQKVFVRDVAAEVNRIYGEEGESLKVSSERVGHVLKDLCLYSRRLGSRGKGLVLDKSTQVRAHELSYAYEILPDAPACGYCHQLQLQESNEVV